MAAPNPKQQRKARIVLDGLFDRPDTVCVIHYSCESFYERPEGRSPRITSIAVRRLDSAQTTSFSIHQLAEIRKVTFEQIKQQYDALEREMLRQFFDHLRTNKDMKYLHWNMRDSNYGFQAIEHRIRVLRGDESELHIVDNKDKFDLPRLLRDIYGPDYIGHPRLTRLLAKNNIKARDFLAGADEANAFEKQDYAALHLSTLRKADVIANIAFLAYDKKLKTDTPWRAMHGGRIIGILTWLGEHPLFSVGMAAVGALSLALAVVFRFWP